MDRNMIRHFAQHIDTGIGRAAGYASDKDMLEHVDAERAAMDPEILAALEATEGQMMRDFLLGGSRQNCGERECPNAPSKTVKPWSRTPHPELHGLQTVIKLSGVLNDPGT